ncbi:ABC transporter ATP-binding protein [Lederbergia citrea]|uniref:ABC transporter ATP-binding protein n=1 Tax=Lederbergia citrea TaxID=2833581 RepID=UPI001BC8E945|nr:dipeptide ABC transporter ATP-binding protein [Lederbergia citrea]MBS4177018.1 dipeptide ABC transporter ATP-binding protein [Lederbergia citrea]MBS4203591.1 dipeptide ABC transporter ATP-binding protein [Lederbergia citrea]
MSEYLLEIKSLKKTFPIRKGILGRKIGEVTAINDVSFFIKKGETLGLVGESGCGKSTTGRTLLRLQEPDEGEIFFEGQNITHLSPSKMRHMRKEMQMVFQDPFASLNPRHTVERILEEPLIVHGVTDSAKRKKRVYELLEIVGLSEFHAKRYPHQFSGGQRQRIGIARALALNPKLIVADEPVSALDVSVQSQILNLLQDLQKQLHLTYLFIAHDLAVVRHITNRVGVMYLGSIVELSPSEQIYENPKHPYTQALLSAVPIPKMGERKERIILEGDVPSPANVPKGCPFHTRCPNVMDICRTVRPEFKEVDKDHYTACHLYH